MILTPVVALLIAATPQAAGPPLEIRWIDVEGGASTLLVTPAGESVLIDAGNPGPRDSSRILKALADANVRRIDHLIVTHFHSDHFGGVAEVASQIPVGTLYDHGEKNAPEAERQSPLLESYRNARVGKRVLLAPGLLIHLRQVPRTPRVSLRLLATREKLGPLPKAGKNRPNTEICRDATTAQPDGSDNRNSAVTLLEFGRFRFFDGGDLTWNTETTLVCPVDRVGRVDVMQIDHHGLDMSNNPVLLRTLAPSVVVFNNGTKKGCGPQTFQTTRDLPSHPAIFQLHRNLRDDGNVINTTPARIANEAEACDGSDVVLQVEPGGKRYTVKVPSKKHQESFTVH
jgi:competence protein ComEC